MLHKFLTIFFVVVVPLASCSSPTMPKGMSVPLIPPLSPQSPFYSQIVEANDMYLSETTNGLKTLNRTHYLNWLLKSKYQTNDYGEIYFLNGDHVMDMYIGNKPTQKVQGVFDTGSDIVWFQGEDRAGKTKFPFFNQSLSSTYRRIHCGDQTRCAHSDLNIVPCRDPQICQFSTGYADGTKGYGIMGTDDAHFKPDWDYITDFIFGSSIRNSDNTMGIIGASNSNYSLPRQFEPDDPKFSYCMSEDLSKNSLVEFGLQAKLAGQSLDMITNRNLAFYYIDVVAIEVNGQDIEVNPSVFEMSEDGERGFIIDSGTTFTELTRVAFDALKKKIEDVVGKPSIKDGRFEICYPSRFFGWSKPKIGIEFTNFVYQIPEDRAWEKFPGSSNDCLKILPPMGYPDMSTLGYEMLLGVNVAHDPKNMLLYHAFIVDIPMIDLQRTTSSL